MTVLSVALVAVALVALVAAVAVTVVHDGYGHRPPPRSHHDPLCAGPLGCHCR